MSEKRKPSTRYRGEPPPKRRALTPTPPPISEPADIELEDELPMKLREGQPLPTLKESQGLDLPTTSFQDISER